VCLVARGGGVHVYLAEWCTKEMCSVVVFGRKKWMATELLVNASVLVINWVRVGRLLSFLQWTCRSKEAKNYLNIRVCGLSRKRSLTLVHDTHV